MALLKKGVAFDFTSTMEDTVRALLAELIAPPILVFPDWDAVIDTPRPFRLHTPHRLYQPSHPRQWAELDPYGTRSRMRRVEY